MTDLSTLSDADLVGLYKQARTAADNGPDIAGMVRTEAQRQGVDPDLALRAARQESGLRADAVSPKGARGVMQLMPATAAELGVDPGDPAQNIRGGIGYLKRQLDAFHDPRLALAAYNAGPGAVQKYGGVPPYAETQDYVARVAAADPAPGGDLGQMSDDQLKALYAQTASPAPAAAPTATAGPARNPVVITNADTGEPYSDKIQGIYGDLMRQGAIDSRAAVGSEKFPRVMVEGGQPGPGEWYVDEAGLHQAPGVRDASFGEAFAAPWARLGGDLTGELQRANNRESVDPQDYGRWGRHDMGAAAKGFASDLGHQVAAPFRMLGDVAGAVASPVTAALQVGIAQPAAHLLDRIPLDQYSNPDILKLDPGHKITGQERHDANVASINLALSAAGAGAGMRGLGGLEGLADANDAAAAAAQARRTAGEAELGDAARARKYIDRKVAAAKASPDALDAAQAAAGGKPVMAAEALGKTGQAALGAIARRDGVTADALAPELLARREGRGQRLLGDFATASGVDPAMASDNIDALVRKGREMADPLYREAYDAGPVWSKRVGEILQTPAGQDAWKRAVRLMRNEGEDPEGLGMAFVEDPKSWESYAPPPMDATAQPERGPVGFAGAPRGPERPPSRGASLLEFIARNGGVADREGELAARNLDLWHTVKPFRPRLIARTAEPSMLAEPGKPAWFTDPEAVAQRAYEAGYFPDRQEAPSPRELYDAMQGEYRGRALYARQPDPAAQQRFDRREAADELAYRGGDPADLPSPEQYVGRPEPRTEPAHQYVPNAKTLDYLKRAFDDQLKPWTSGKLDWDHEGLGILKLKQDLVRELAGDEVAGQAPLSPKYREALDISGDYLTHEQAFKEGKRFLFDTRVSDLDFGKRLQELTPPQMATFQEGLARGLLEDADKGWLTPRRLSNDLVRKKLRMALGKARGDQLIDKIRQEAEMAKFERRVDPEANSSTAQMSREMADQDEAGRAAQAAAAVLEHGSKGLVGGAASLLRAGARGAADRIRTAGMSTGARDEAGRMLLMTPAELAELLRQSAPAAGPAAIRNYRGMFGAAALARPATAQPQPRRGQRLAH